MVNTEGLQSGTLASNLLLAEYVNTSGGQVGYGPEILISGNVGAVIELQCRNAANSASNWGHRMFILASTPCVVIPAPSPFILENNERLRVILVTGILGSIQVTMFS